MKTPSSQPEFNYIISGFTDKTLPAGDWTHEAHMITGLWYASKLGYDKSLEFMRENIIKYVEARGKENTDSSGYHESITVFWMWLLNSFWERYKASNTTFEDVCNQLLTSKYTDQGIMLQFYSREVLFSKEARLAFIEPDLQPFDFEKIA